MLIFKIEFHIVLVATISLVKAHRMLRQKGQWRSGTDPHFHACARASARTITELFRSQNEMATCVLFGNFLNLK